MTVGDIIYNDNFDFNANYAIYKRTIRRSYWIYHTMWYW